LRNHDKVVLFAIKIMPVRPFLPALLLLFLLPFIVFAHNGSIKGGVYDKGSNAPLPGANVAIGNTGKGTTTDIFGIYTFTNLQEGTYQLTISYLGYASETITVEVKNSETSLVKTQLSSSDLQLSEVTVTATQDNPLETIGAVDILLRPVRSSQEVLKNVPGLFIAQHAGGGKAEQIFLRGFDIDHGTDINLTVDDMPVNMVSHAHGQGYSDLHFIIPETIDRVDFGKGPYQVSKGNFATAGYAGFHTKNAIAQNSLKMEAGRFNSYRTVGLFDLLGEKQKEKQQHAYLATEYMFSNGYFDAPQNFNRLNLFGHYYGVLDNNKIISASLSSFRSKWDASGQIPQRAVDNGSISRFGAIDNTEGGATSRHNANISIISQLPGGALLKNQVYLVNYNIELYSNFTFFLNDSINGDQIKQQEKRNIYGYNGTYSKDLTFWGKLLRSEVGVGLRYDNIQGLELSRTSARRITLSEIAKGDVNELNAYGFLNETWYLSPRWTVNAALRFDQFYYDYVSTLQHEAVFKRQTAAQHRLSPKLNLYYTYNPSLQLYFSSGMGFHSNDTRVSVDRNNRKILPAAYGTDIGIMYKPFKRLLINPALWALDLEQEFIYVGDEGIVEPSGSSRRYGLDVSARYQISDLFYTDADLNLARPRFKENEEGENFVPLAPALTSTGGITYKGKEGLSGSLRYRYLADRPANEDYSLVADGYFLLDLVASYTRKNWQLSFTIENMLDQDWKEAQFETESRLRHETASVSEMHFTPGTPFFIKAGIALFF
jgi:hypothetical protein